MIDGVPAKDAHRLWRDAVQVVRYWKRGGEAEANAYYQRSIASFKAAINAKVQAAKARAVAKIAQIEAIVQTDGDFSAVSPADEIIATTIDEQVAHIVGNLDDDDKIPLHVVMKNDNRIAGVKIENSQSEPIVFEIPHGHKILAASRAFFYKEAQLVGVKRGLSAQCWDDDTRPVVFDIGSGATGIINAIELMREVRDVERVYHHCAFPYAGPHDRSRERTLLPYSDMINWLDGRKPVLGKVNVCRHLARDCDCYSLYSKQRYVFAIHSSYYFTDCDWDRVFHNVDEVCTVGHLPETFGLMVPTTSPEFKWDKLEKCVTVPRQELWANRLRSLLTGADEYVCFEPLRDHGTTYVQRNPRIDIEAGGFQMGPVWLVNCADALTRSLNRLLFSAACTMMVVPALGQSLIFASVRRSILAKCFACLSGLLFMPLFAVRLHRFWRQCPLPLWGTRYTVRVVDDVTMTHNRENLSHRFKFARYAPTELLPRRIGTFVPKPEVAKEVASTILMSRKPESEVENLALARCLRLGLSEAESRDTLNIARDIALRLSAAKNEMSPLTGKSSHWDTRAFLCALAFLLAFALLTAFLSRWQRAFRLRWQGVMDDCVPALRRSMRTMPRFARLIHYVGRTRYSWMVRAILEDPASLGARLLTHQTSPLVLHLL